MIQARTCIARSGRHFSLLDGIKARLLTLPVESSFLFGSYDTKPILSSFPLLQMRQERARGGCQQWRPARSSMFTGPKLRAPMHCALPDAHWRSLNVSRERRGWYGAVTGSTRTGVLRRSLAQHELDCGS